MNIKYVLPSKFISPSRVMIPAAPLFRSPPRVSSTCTRSYVIVPLGDTDDDLASDNSSTLRSSTTPDLIATAESFLNHGIGIRLGLSTNELPFETNPTFVLDDPYHSPPSVLQPNFSSDPFPALPSLRSDRIRLRVFTHRSYFARPGHVFEDRPNDPSPDNEKYEHLGDTVLNLIVTCIIHNNYPYLRVGPSTKLRSLVVGNPTLADISRRYDLPRHLRLHPAQVVTLRTSLNVQADVFESYVGGLYLDQGLAAVETWLRALFTAYIKEAYLLVRTQYGLPSPPQVGNVGVDTNGGQSTPQCGTAGEGTTAHGIDPGVDAIITNMVSMSVPPTTTVTSHTTPTVPLIYHPAPSGVTTTIGHLALFNQLLQRGQKAVEWIYASDGGDGTHTTPIWSVRVEVDGEEYGRGKGGTKKAARNEAAKEGLVRLGIDV